MANVKIFWDPMGFELESRGKHELLRSTDGDTPYISLPIRMLSIDTPEVHYPGNEKPSNWDARLVELANWIDQGKAPINNDLGKKLKPKLAHGKAGTLQLSQGKTATLKFVELLEQSLTKPSGSKRKLYLRSADESFDSYGRLLAYISPHYTKKELVSLSRLERATINLQMVKTGWAASFPIYPSLPRYTDLVFLQEAAKEAYENKHGAWSDPLMLTGYEYRMCVKLYKVTKKIMNNETLSSNEKNSWVTRFCFDMITREVFFPQDYYKVKPYNRIFIWPQDLVEAVAKLNLLPKDTV